jgi:RNA polymerase sigma-70 factor (ECF subfamily)
MTRVLVEPSIDCSIADGCIPICNPDTEDCRNVIPDEELVERSLCGEEDAFRHLYERYRRPIYVAVCRIIVDPEEARDATQEIFITVYRSLALYNPRRARFFPWIYRVATNRAIDYWRIRRRRAEVPLTVASEMPLKKVSVGRMGMPTMERILELKERAAEVRRFLEELPQPQRRFFILRYYDGLKLREIAEKEGYRLGTVKSSLHKATQTMRRKLRKIGVRS